MNTSLDFRIWAMALLFGCAIGFSACGAAEEDPQSLPKAHIDPELGIDTTKVLLSDSMDLATKTQVRIPFVKDGLWGYQDTNGVVIVEPIYESATPFVTGLAIVKTGTGFGLVDKMGAEVIPPTFGKIEDCGCGVYAIKQENGYALINKYGKRIDKGTVSSIVPYGCEEDRIPVRYGKNLGFIDSKGKEVVPFEFDAAEPFFHGVAPARKEGEKNWRIIGKNGKAINDEQFEMIYPFVEGFGVGMKQNATGQSKYGVVDSSGKTIIPFQYARITGSFSGEYIACAAYDPYEIEAKGLPENANTWFIFDRAGEKVGETHFTLWDDFSEGLVAASENDKFGFMDATGKLVIPFQYDWVCGFKNGMAWAGKDDKFGFIDKNGKFVIPMKYTAANDYVFMENDGAIVRDSVNGPRFFIDKNGKEYR